MDDVIEPAALEDLENPLLAAFSPHGDVSGWVSPDLTAQRYGGGGAHGGWRDPPGPAPEAASCPPSHLLSRSSPPDPTHTQVYSLSCTGLGLFLGPQELPEGAPERHPPPLCSIYKIAVLQERYCALYTFPGNDLAASGFPGHALGQPLVFSVLGEGKRHQHTGKGTRCRALLRRPAWMVGEGLYPASCSARAPSPCPACPEPRTPIAALHVRRVHRASPRTQRVRI